MRTNESPGVEINEIDLTFNTELPYGTTSLVVGYAKQGPTDELVNVTSPEEFERIYGEPENAAERYMYHTAKQVLNANGNLLVTRLPYGSGDGDGYATKYSALVYPYIPVDTKNPLNTYAGLLTADSSDVFDVFTFTTQYSGSKSTSDVFSVANAASSVCVSGIDSSFTLEGTFQNMATGGFVTASLIFDVSGSIETASGEMSAVNWFGKFDPVGVTEYADSYTVTISGGGSLYAFVSGTISIEATPINFGNNLTDISPNNASHYFLGQPIHVTLDDDTYFNWLQGGINWKSIVDKQIEDISDVGYGALIVVNEGKTSISNQYEGYYVAIADNSKMDKGSNFDSIRNIKSFNKDVVNDNEWVTLNDSALAFSLTGSYFEHSGSVSEIVESVPDFDFSNNKSGGFGDSIVLSLFKVRPTIYNEDTRVLDKVLYETYIGSFDSTRTIQNQNGGSASNFFIEDVVNNSSKGIKVFVNPYISKFSGQWFDSQTHEPTKFVRVACGDRDVIGSSSSDIIDSLPAEPHGSASLIVNSSSLTLETADSMYGVGEAVPCQAEKQKYIGNLPKKLEKALRLAENYETIRIDLVPEGGLGTVWTGMNLDMNNWPAKTLSRNGATRIKELFDDNVFINGILNAHTFDADSDGLLSQNNGSSSEASDLYGTIASIYNQFCQYTRKDCLYIADPLRYIFVQGAGDVKVLDNKKLNFSQHIFWPLKNLFGGINSSFACTYANWFKINDSSSDRFTWVPPSGFAANLMIKTDTNFFPWYASAGLTRGVLSGILDIGINPSQKQRDLLYKNGLNATVYWPGEGHVVWGQKTLQRKPSAFDRINVRRLFLWSEKAVLRLAKYFVFEQNTPFTRNRLKAAIDPILGYAKSNEGIYDYMIVCDDRNNTAEVIDRGELIVDIYIKPVRVAEYILINFIATRSGQRFEELV